MQLLTEHYGIINESITYEHRYNATCITSDAICENSRVRNTGPFLVD